MNRSVTSRNLAGGFLGGALGILISWYVAPMALPFGVLLGVVVGWWREDIAQMFAHSIHAAQRFWRALIARAVPDKIRLPHRSFFGRFKTLLGVCTTNIGNGISRALGYVVIPFRWIAVGARVPMRAVVWASHPSSMALLITISAIMVGASINAFAFGMLWPWPETKTIGGGASGNPVEIVSFTLSDIVAFTGFTTFFLTMFGISGTIWENDRGEPMRNFYARWERYAQYSPITYFARELFRFFKSEVTIAIFFALAVAYWVTLGGALIALVTIPVATFVTFMIGLCKIAQRAAHWGCFGVTMVVTSVSAFFFYDNFNNEAVLWVAALSTGMISGLTTEGLRYFGLWWSNTKTGRHYLDIWYDEDKALPFSIAVPAWRSLLRMSDDAGQRMIRFVA